MKALLAELHRRDRLLALVGWLHLALALAFAAGTLVDDRRILGLDPWVKPMKFAVSIAVYTWTVAWLLGDVRAGAPRAARLVSVGVAVSMVVEIACIAGQSLRGQPSHFNVRSVLDGVVFSTMGTMILLNTVLAVWLLALYFRRGLGLPAPYLWGVRLGLAMMLLASAQGGMMIGHGSHTVGAPDGGAGLPFVNWSTEAGDLRAAHAVGLHGLQVLPLLGALLARSRRPASEAARTRVVFALTAVYAAAFVVVLAGALSGRPLLRL